MPRARERLEGRVALQPRPQEAGGKGRGGHKRRRVETGGQALHAPPRFRQVKRHCWRKSLMEMATLPGIEPGLPP